MFKYSVALFFSSILFGQIDTTIVIDAPSYYDWTYYSIEQGSIVDISNPENSLDWDFAIQRKHIKTNGGLSGLGDGGAFVDSSITWIDEWENINELPQNIVLETDTLLGDFYNPITHMFEEGVKNPALNSWGWFDENYHLNVTHYALFILAANGQDIIKFWPYNYYNQNGQGGNISIRYQTGMAYGCLGLYGDINADEVINVVDIIGIVNYIVSSGYMDESQILCSDLNYDQLINVVDVIIIVEMIISAP